MHDRQEPEFIPDHNTALSVEGLVSDEMIAYHEARTEAGVGRGLALLLAQSGCRVRLAVNGIVAGKRVPSMVRDYAVGELHKLGVEIEPYVRLFGADEESVYFQHVTSGEAVILDEVDTLVSHHALRRNAGLAEELNAYGKRLILIGDCLGPRTAEEAVMEGLKAAMAI